MQVLSIESNFKVTSLELDKIYFGFRVLFSSLGWNPRPQFDVYPEILDHPLIHVVLIENNKHTILLVDSLYKPPFWKSQARNWK